MNKAHYDLFDRPEAALIASAPKDLRAQGDPPHGDNLPDIKELYVLFDNFNRIYFEGALPPVKIAYSDRMLIAGSYFPAKREIKIGRKYHQIFGNELEDTLKHEMIHVVNPRHDRSFKELAGRIGASLRAKSHPDLRGSFRYIYICPSCMKEYTRRKRLRMASCGICSPGGKFDPRFKLRLIKR